MKVFAHRGRHGTHTENSRPAVISAYGSEIDGLEVDLQRLGDGRIVFHHDVTIKQITAKRSRFHDLGHLTLEKLSQLTPERPITLREALNLKPDRMTLVLECKPHRNNMGFCRTLLSTLRSNQPNNIVLSSESWTILRHLSRKTDYPLAPVLRDTTGLNHTYLNRNFFDEVHLRWNLALKDEIREPLQRREIPIITWTVNDRSTFNRLKQLGIDGVMTDNESWCV